MKQNTAVNEIEMAIKAGLAVGGPVKRSGASAGRTDRSMREVKSEQPHKES